MGGVAQTNGEKAAFSLSLSISPVSTPPLLSSLIVVLIFVLREHYLSLCSLHFRFDVCTGLETWLPVPVDVDTEFCLENNQSVDGDAEFFLKMTMDVAKKKKKHKTCLQKVNK